MKSKQSTSGTQLLAGYMVGISSVVANALSASCVQALQGAVPDFQLSAIRSAATGLTFIIGGLIIGSDFNVGVQYVPGLIYYGVCFLFLNVGIFGAATYLPLAELQGVVTMVSIMFAILQSRLLFNVDIVKSHIIAAVVCIVGIILTVQPPWLFKNVIITSDTIGKSYNNSSGNVPLLDSSTSSGQSVLLGYILSIIGGAAYGVSFDISGILLRNVRTMPKGTYTMSVCTIGSVAVMFYVEDPVYVSDLKQLLLVLGHALFSAAASSTNVYAASILPGPSLSILFSWEVITMLACQYTAMHSIKPGNYNWIEVIGCVIIVFGASVPGVVDLLSYRAKANKLP